MLVFLCLSMLVVLCLSDRCTCLTDWSWLQEECKSKLLGMSTTLHVPRALILGWYARIPAAQDSSACRGVCRLPTKPRAPPLHTYGRSRGAAAASTGAAQMRQWQRFPCSWPCAESCHPLACMAGTAGGMLAASYVKHQRSQARARFTCGNTLSSLEPTWWGLVTLF